jgi:hypothetical protein
MRDYAYIKTLRRLNRSDRWRNSRLENDHCLPAQSRRQLVKRKWLQHDQLVGKKQDIGCARIVFHFPVKVRSGQADDDSGGNPSLPGIDYRLAILVGIERHKQFIWLLTRCERTDHPVPQFFEKRSPPFACDDIAVAQGLRCGDKKTDIHSDFCLNENCRRSLSGAKPHKK